MPLLTISLRSSSACSPSRVLHKPCIRALAGLGEGRRQRMQTARERVERENGRCECGGKVFDEMPLRGMDRMQERGVNDGSGERGSFMGLRERRGIRVHIGVMGENCSLFNV
ncbi:hypothetical protein Lal_00019785 [Lupinus albus]|nr:hypothetical protein Lal_00019785 [Lupinus albus]